jgi:hypothetical protein
LINFLRRKLIVSRELGIGITGNIFKCDGEQLIGYFGLEIDVSTD